MHIRDIFSQGATFSFEFFPPKGAGGFADLLESIRELEPLRPSFVSVTYGAGGSTRELTHDLVVRLRETSTLDPVPHLTCVGHTPEEVDAILARYAAAGIGNIMALRGDVPRDQAADQPTWRGLRYAGDLVARIRAFNERGVHPDRRGFGIGVAGYPEGHAETPNRLVEMDRLKAKVDAGADFIVTQLFFDNRDFYDFVERCELASIHIPIIAGVMPIQSIAGIKRMAGLSGARLPAPLLRALQRAGDDPEAVAHVGAHWAAEQCRDLVDHNVAGLHLYTLNKSSATRHVYENLGIKHSSALRNTPTTTS